MVSFVRAFVSIMLNFPFKVMVWSLLVDAENVLWEVAILKILKHDEIWGTDN